MRKKIVSFLMDLAWRISSNDFSDEVVDVYQFGCCEDCSERMPDEPNWCR